MTTKEARSFCRICCAHCGVVMSIDESANRIVDIRGDKDNPMTQGYMCFKGLQAEEAHHGPSRLLHPLKRQADGTFAQIDREQALDEIAAKLRELLDRHGPASIAEFTGTQGYLVSTYPMNLAFMAAIGSPQHFSTVTIDQSAKIVNFERQGGWAAGLQYLGQSEVLLLFGANPLLSHSTMPVMGPDPTRMLKKAKARGMKLICIDPRRSETAHHADVFLQPYPGCDAAIAAAMIRLILLEGWEDKQFVAEHVGAERMAALKTAVAPFAPERVEKWADVAPGQIRAAAQMFARDCRTGAAYASTGPCMAPFSNLTQHLVETLNIVCGRMRRAGDKAVVDMMAPRRTLYAEAIAPPRSWEAVPQSRIRGVGHLSGDRLSSTLAEEILTLGEGRIRALIVAGGNPASALPDQMKIVEALKSLELLVSIDPYLTTTAQLAHYILPPRTMYERADLPLTVPGFPLYPMNWAQYAEPVLRPPSGSDLVEDWYVFWSLARRLGVQIVYNGVALDMAVPPTTEQLLAIRVADAPATLDELKRHQSGKVYAPASAIVQPARPGANGQFDVMPADVAGEMAQLLDTLAVDAIGPASGFTHLLATRRMHDVMNTVGMTWASVLRRNPSNPAYLHPEELEALGLRSGDEVSIASAHGRIAAVVDADETVRRGVVSIAHCWGGLPGEDGPGANVNLLISCQTDVQSINAMPRMSAVPVSISKPGTN